MATFTRNKVDGIPDRVVAKWSAQVVSEGFVAFPKRLLRCLNVLFPEPRAIDQLRVVLAVADFRRPKQSREPSLQYLAFIAGMSEQEFRSALSALSDRGIVELSGSDDGLRVSLEPLLEKIMRETTDKGSLPP